MLISLEPARLAASISFFILFFAAFWLKISLDKMDVQNFKLVFKSRFKLVLFQAIRLHCRVSFLPLVSS